MFGLRVTQRSQMQAAVEEARNSPLTTIIDFRVEQEDSVYPMVPAGADLDKMIRRPKPEPEDEHNPLYETGKDK